MLSLCVRKTIINLRLFQFLMVHLDCPTTISREQKGGDVSADFPVGDAVRLALETPIRAKLPQPSGVCRYFPWAFIHDDILWCSHSCLIYSFFV
jgi:hypothetical protein